MRILLAKETNVISGGGAGTITINGYSCIYVTGDSSFTIGNLTLSSPAGSFKLVDIFFYSNMVTDSQGNVLFSESSGEFCHHGVQIRVIEVSNGQAYLLTQNC